MRKLIIFTLSIFSLISFNTLARDTTLHLPIDEAMATENFKEKLTGNVQFFFGDQKFPVPKATMGEFVTNKKTNNFGKSDVQSCQWVLLSALISLQDRALAEGGNAVVDIVSYYKRHIFSSESEFECHAGGIMAGVALKGRVVTLP